MYVIFSEQTTAIANSQLKPQQLTQTSFEASGFPREQDNMNSSKINTAR
jgi:hypothetical protein